MNTALLLLLLPVVGLMGWGIEHRIDRVNRRVARVERKVDLILDHLGIQEENPGLARVAALAAEGKRIHAIKAYREITGAGLKEAKEAVDRLAPPA
ncbi:ribosomal protein L7/L12 [Streptomyces sp. NPDC049577]|uniref:ribosomal protein L7/L12 n=1 Tax=Streptomyces sp. NPDC049577 TaxID=3155153 RepID=UPI0034201315